MDRQGLLAEILRTSTYATSENDFIKVGDLLTALEALELLHKPWYDDVRATSAGVRLNSSDLWNAEREHLDAIRAEDQATQDRSELERLRADAKKDQDALLWINDERNKVVRAYCELEDELLEARAELKRKLAPCEQRICKLRSQLNRERETRLGLRADYMALECQTDHLLGGLAQRAEHAENERDAAQTELNVALTDRDVMAERANAMSLELDDLRKELTTKTEALVEAEERSARERDDDERFADQIDPYLTSCGV
jgi:chromosome segregation ATPase